MRTGGATWLRNHLAARLARHKPPIFIEQPSLIEKVRRADHDREKCCAAMFGGNTPSPWVAPVQPEECNYTFRGITKENCWWVAKTPIESRYPAPATALRVASKTRFLSTGVEPQRVEPTE
jgi:hypothetical protein